MKMRVYNFLVNRHDGIRSRYHRLHDGAGRKMKLLSYVYLLWLNFCYYILFCRFLGKREIIETYERKRLLTGESESASFMRSGLTAESLAEELSGYDIISFDLFDTLIFRPFSEPGDLFYFLGAELGILDFKRIRTEQEALARTECYREKGHYEVTFSHIWNHIEKDLGLSADRGMAAEQKLEMEFCYANPFMLEVFRRLRNKGKKIIVVSDMYLPGSFLGELLERKGYTGVSALYVSCEHGKSKRDGTLYELVREELSKNAKTVHLGDNEYSDIKIGRQRGFAVKYYPNVNKNAGLYRPYDMSPLVGGAYRGIVDNHLYCGLKSYSMEYEYGYIYGGLFVLGYCDFIHEYGRENSVDKILFLSRDGDILKQAYDYLYPEENTEYVYWSRKAAAKLEAGYDKRDYFRRFLFHKVNQGCSIREILHSMELDFMADLTALNPDDSLTDKNVLLLKKELEANWSQVLEAYSEQMEAAGIYYGNILKDVRKAAAVDIGWAGSGAMALRHLVFEEWRIPCEITGIVAGTNTVYNGEPEASESFLQSGRMAAYLYSQRHNRDLLKKHDLNRDYNVFWELLLSSPTPQFQGFYKKREKRRNSGEDIQEFHCPDCREIELWFGKTDANEEGIREIQRGIMDFVREYREHFENFPYMFHISGRDAYAPMLVAASYGERYLKEIEKRFKLEINVN